MHCIPVFLHGKENADSSAPGWRGIAVLAESFGEIHIQDDHDDDVYSGNEHEQEPPDRAFDDFQHDDDVVDRDDNGYECIVKPARRRYAGSGTGPASSPRGT